MRSIGSRDHASASSAIEQEVTIIHNSRWMPGSSAVYGASDVVSSNARISPDGRWIAYKGYESGWFIYIRQLHFGGQPVAGLESRGPVV